MSETKELVLLQNQTPKPTCLILRTRVTNEDHFGGELDMWSDEDVQIGSEIMSNSGLYILPTPEATKRSYVRSLEVTKIIKRRDHKGTWDHDSDRKNHQSYYTVHVQPHIVVEEATA